MLSKLLGEPTPQSAPDRVFLDVQVSMLEELLSGNVIPIIPQPGKFRESYQLLRENLKAMTPQQAVDEMFTSEKGTPIVEYSFNEAGQMEQWQRQGNHRLPVLVKAYNEGFIPGDTHLKILASRQAYAKLPDGFLEDTIGKQDALILRYLLSIPFKINTWMKGHGVKLSFRSDDMQVTHVLMTRLLSYHINEGGGTTGEQGSGFYLPKAFSQLSQEQYSEFISSFYEEVMRVKAVSLQGLSSWANLLTTVQANSGSSFPECFRVLDSFNPPLFATNITGIYDSFDSLQEPYRIMAAVAIYLSPGSLRQRENIITDMKLIARNTYENLEPGQREAFIEGFYNRALEGSFQLSPHMLSLELALYSAHYGEEGIEEKIGEVLERVRQSNVRKTELPALPLLEYSKVRGTGGSLIEGKPVNLGLEGNSRSTEISPAEEEEFNQFLEEGGHTSIAPATNDEIAALLRARKRPGAARSISRTPSSSKRSSPALSAPASQARTISGIRKLLYEAYRTQAQMLQKFVKDYFIDHQAPFSLAELQYDAIAAGYEQRLVSHGVFLDASQSAAKLLGYQCQEFMNGTMQSMYFRANRDNTPSSIGCYANYLIALVASPLSGGRFKEKDLISHMEDYGIADPEFRKSMQLYMNRNALLGRNQSSLLWLSPKLVECYGHGSRNR